MYNLLLGATSGWDLFTNFSPDQRFALVIIVVGCATAIIISTVGIVGAIVGATHKRRAEMDMKRELLDRGMNAEDISRIVESTPPQSFLERWAAAQGKGQ